MTQWFYAKDNQQRGPVSSEELRNLLAKGEITPSSLVWRQGMPQWAQYSQVAELNIEQQTNLSSVQKSHPQTSVSAQGQVLASTMTAVPAQPNNPLALTGFILGIVSIIFCCCGLTAIVGLVLSIIARIQISQNPTQFGSNWMATAGILLNALVLAANIISTIYIIATGQGLEEILRQLQSSSTAP